METRRGGWSRSGLLLGLVLGVLAVLGGWLASLGVPLVPTGGPLDQACNPRPRPTLTVNRQTNARSEVIVTAATGTVLQALRFFDSAQSSENAYIDAPGHPPGRTGSFTANLGGVGSATFYVSAQGANLPTTVHFVVVDSCGDWTTLIGGGTSALFATATPLPSGCLPVQPAPPDTERNAPYINGGTGGSGVHTMTGSYRHNATDVAIAGWGPTPQFTRTYNSNDTRGGPMGPGWTHSYAMRLTRPDSATQDLLLVGPQGRSDRYVWNGSTGLYQAPRAIYATLVWNGSGYTVTHPDQSAWRFDTCGRLIAVLDRYGNQATVSQGANGVSAVSDPAGRGSLTFVYTGGLLTRVDDWAGRQVQFGYVSGRLETVTDRVGQVTTYRYDGGGRLDRITNARGHHVLTNAYDAQGRVSSQTDVNGQQSLFDWSFGSGARITYPPAAHEPAFRPVQRDYYSGEGWFSQRESFPTSTELVRVFYEHDPATGNRTQATDANGHVTNYCYDLRGNVTRKILPTIGGIRPMAVYEYDARNNLIFEYPPKAVNTSGLAVVDCNTSLAGRLDVLFRTDHVYDGLNQLTTTTERFYNYAGGARIGGQRDAITKLEYHASYRGLTITEIPPRGNQGPTPDYAYATRHTYYESGSQAGLRATSADALGNKAYACYDSVGRKVRTGDVFASAAQGCDDNNHNTLTTYDNEDRVTQTQSAPVTIGGARLTSSSEYDAVGNKTRTTDPRGQLTRYVYTAANLLQEVQQSKDATDPNDDSNKLRAVYEYDLLGNLQWVRRYQGTTQVRQSEYRSDGLKRLRAEIEYPGAGTLTRTYLYDANGNRTRFTKPDGNYIEYAYDALNRQTSVSHFGSYFTPNVTFQYDLHGQRTQMSDGIGITYYQYDERDAPVRIDSPSAEEPARHGIEYRYDLDGRPEFLVYPDGDLLTHRYDAAGRMDRLTDWANRITQYTYTPDGKLQSTTHVNSTVQNHYYDNVRRTTQVQNLFAGGTTIVNDIYTRDENGNPTQIGGTHAWPTCSGSGCTSFSNYTQSYTYDRINRLTNSTSSPPVDGVANIGYTLDPVSNFQSVSLVATPATTGPATYTTDTADRLLQTAAPGLTQSYTYDNNGNNLTANATSTPPFSQTNTYDIADRLVNVWRQGVQTRYVYNGDGQRRLKQSAGVLTRYIYDSPSGTPRLLVDTSRRYVYGPGGVAYTTSPGGETVLNVFHTDAQGSVRALTNAAAQLVYVSRFDPYGLPRAASGSAASGQPLGYTGMQYDPEVELVNLNARLYAPGLGRFIQRDTVMGDTGNPVTLNRYTYANANPLVYTDPSGHSGDDEPIPPMGIWRVAMGLAGASQIQSLAQQGIDRINPLFVRFSQTTAQNAWTRRGHPLEGLDIETAAIAIRQGNVGLTPGQARALWDPINVFLHTPQGQATQLAVTYDNRRLAVFQRAGVEIRYRLHDSLDALNAYLRSVGQPVSNHLDWTPQLGPWEQWGVNIIIRYGEGVRRGFLP